MPISANLTTYQGERKTIGPFFAIYSILTISKKEIFVREKNECESIINEIF